ncbi:MAG: KpsF/GutQ family sugar-phosphate isomerase, partial [Actinobacteria bacterium]|nr:KpsF/GutQ family sugar-phosphate isomerase [Actinomycetota bacterium]
MTTVHQPTSLAGVMHAEADAIARAATRLTSSSTAAAVGVLTECKGKVIVTGVGKSGLVAQKFVA